MPRLFLLINTCFTGGGKFCIQAKGEGRGHFERPYCGVGAGAGAKLWGRQRILILGYKTVKKKQV